MALRRIILLLTAWLASTGSLHGQVLTGRVVETGTNTPVAGALVRASALAGGDQSTALSDAQGSWLMRLTGEGPWSVTAQRIGYDAPPGHAVHMDSVGDDRILLQLSPRAVDLGSIAAEADGRCVLPEDDGGATDLLWREARKTLEAVRWTEDLEFTYLMVRRYQRLASNEAPVADLRADTVLAVSMRPFVTPGAESLHRDGYVQPDAGTWYYKYFAPDAEVILSDHFLTHHCFSALPVAGDRIGLQFRPLEERRVADVAGTLWLDRTSGALRSIEYGYTRDPLGGDLRKIGGELSFAQLDSGHWVISRWTVRGPRMRQGLMLLIIESGGELLGVYPKETAERAAREQAAANLARVAARRSAGKGIHLTRADLLGGSVATLEDVLSDVPHVASIDRRGNRGIRLADGGSCPAALWVDGVLLNGETDERSPAWIRSAEEAFAAFLSLPVGVIAALEIYDDPDDLPAELVTHGSSRCGAIAVWSMPGG